MGEIDRELTMVSGALNGVQQRVASLVAVLQTALPPDVLSMLTEAEGSPRLVANDDPVTVMGRRLRNVYEMCQELEDTLELMTRAQL